MKLNKQIVYWFTDVFIGLKIISKVKLLKHIELSICSFFYDILHLSER